MKRLFFVIAVFLLSTSALAQTQTEKTTWRWGLTAGGNLSVSKLSLTQPNTIDANGYTRPGVWGGGFVEWSPALFGQFHVQMEVLYSTLNALYSMAGTGTPIKGLNPTATLNLEQLNAPLLLKYYVLPSFSIDAGPSFNINTKGKEKTSDGIVTKLTNNQFHLFQVGASVGATYYYKNFFVNAKYNYLFGQVNNNDYTDAQYFPNMYGKVKFGAATLGVGYTFKIKHHPKPSE